MKIVLTEETIVERVRGGGKVGGRMRLDLKGAVEIQGSRAALHMSRLEKEVEARGDVVSKNRTCSMTLSRIPKGKTCQKKEVLADSSRRPGGRGHYSSVQGLEGSSPLKGGSCRGEKRR